MHRPALLLAIALSASMAPAMAQRDVPVSPYVGEEIRQIKALAPERIEGLLAGKGLGYARAAELNGIPGPMHVLELADALELSPQQRSATQALYTQVLDQARPLGAQLVEAEAALDALLRSGRADADQVLVQLQRIAGIEARLRHVHLAAHLAQEPLLTPAQVQTYSALRGYHGPAPAHGHKPVHHGH